MTPRLIPEDVLLNFGESVGLARRSYRQFVQDGIAMGRRSEFQGGGLVRSAGGDPTGLLGRKTEEREFSDARILGSGDFVAEALQKAGELQEGIQRCSLSSLCEKITSCFGVKMEELRSPIKKASVTEAKAAFSFLAIKKMGYSGRDVGNYLNMRSYSAIRCAEKGRTVINNKGFLWDSTAK